MRNAAFTIVEIVVVIGLFALLMLFASGIFLSHNSLYYAQRAEINAVGTARSALDDITDEIREAAAVAASTDYQGATYTTDADTLVLSLPAVDAANVVLGNVYDYVVYYIDAANPKQLRKIAAPNAASFRRAEDRKLLSEHLFALSFTYNDPDPTNASRIIINLTAEDTARLASRKITLVEDVYLRNRD